MSGTAGQGTSIDFERVWAALDTEQLGNLLPELSPRPGRRGSARYLVLECPGCRKRQAWLYPARDGRGPRLHCNRQNNCNYEATLWEYLKEREGGDGKAALAVLVSATGLRPEDVASNQPLSRRSKQGQMRSPFQVRPISSPSPVAVPDGLEVKQAAYSAALAGSPVVAYLRSRGLSMEAAARMGFGYCADWPDEHRARLTYPLTDRQGRIVGIEGRLIPTPDGSVHGPKCLCDGVKAGVFSPRPLRLDDLHLCEGPFDAVFLCILGMDAVALCGTAPPDWLLPACAFRRFYTAFDADEAGDKAAGRTVEAVEGLGSRVQRLRPPEEGRDWGDYLPMSAATRWDAYWRAQGVADELRGLRVASFKLSEQIRFLRDPERMGIPNREVLLTRVETGIKALGAQCDLDTGYSDPDDPFACDVLLHLRGEFGYLMAGQTSETSGFFDEVCRVFGPVTLLD